MRFCLFNTVVFSFFFFFAFRPNAPLVFFFFAKFVAGSAPEKKNVGHENVGSIGRKKKMETHIPNFLGKQYEKQRSGKQAHADVKNEEQAAPTLRTDQWRIIQALHQRELQLLQHRINRDVKKWTVWDVAAAGRPQQVLQRTEDNLNLQVPPAAVPDCMSPGPAERREAKPTVGRRRASEGAV